MVSYDSDGDVHKQMLITFHKVLLRAEQDTRKDYFLFLILKWWLNLHFKAHLMINIGPCT